MLASWRSNWLRDGLLFQDHVSWLVQPNQVKDTLSKINADRVYVHAVDDPPLDITFKLAPHRDASQKRRTHPIKGPPESVLALGKHLACFQVRRAPCRNSSRIEVQAALTTLVWAGALFAHCRAFVRGHSLATGSSGVSRRDLLSGHIGRYFQKPFLVLVRQKYEMATCTKTYHVNSLRIEGKRFERTFLWNLGSRIP